ncbi:MAG: hypothetical protein ABI681_02895 [Gemmatimonadales bacterium]
MSLASCNPARLALAIAICLVTARLARGQDMPAGHQMDMDSAKSGTTVSAGISGILLGTVAQPGVANRTLAEGYLTQPMAMAAFTSPGGRFSGEITIDFEGATLERGELNAGMHGEGYVDRRHPHTLLHEVAATGFFGAGLSRLSVTAGRGFVPFGTDDPMSRPFVKYPVNHHLAQILERAMVAVAGASGPIVLEASTFGGDEPESPYDMPNWGRFGDSWSARLTGRTTTGFEAQGSIARVKSPEQPHGGGLDHRKLSASVRYDLRGRYLLAEWARTKEVENGNTAFTFQSALAEGAVTRGRMRVGLRAERTERPEEERSINVFRTPRPHSDLSILGRTRWLVLTANTGATFRRKRSLFAPFIEVSMQRPRSLDKPTAFDPREFYGTNSLWSYSAGIRVGSGMRHERMGRYGVSASHAHGDDMQSHEDM